MDKIKLTCDVCNGALEMQSGGEKAICEYCGTVYLLERLQEKIKEITVKGNVKVVDADFTIRGGVLERYNGESTEVIIPDNVTIIGENAFKDCRGVTKVVIPESVNTIERGAFYNCTSLLSVNLPENLEVISDHMFSGCTKLESIHIPDSIKKIGKWAFDNCKSLKSIIIPDSVEELDRDVFSCCSNLKSINGKTFLDENLARKCKGCRFPSGVELCSAWDYLCPDTPIAWKCNKRCQYCGGKFNGVFNKTCSNCGKPKDY